jgi:hypothetical protein
MKQKPPTKVLDVVELWDVEIRHLVDEIGLTAANARTSVILQWMLHGDFRPLAAEIRKGRPLSDGVLNALATMIEEDRLNAKPLYQGRPVDPTKFARDYLAALLYGELIKDTPSDVAFQEVAEVLSTTEDSVRKAVTRYRK